MPAKCPNLNRIGCIEVREFPDEQLHGGDVNPDFGTGDRSLEVLGQAAVSIEPSQGSFDDPATRQQFKAGGISGAFDYLDGRVA